MASFIEENGLTGFDHAADIFGQVWAAFGVSAQPSYVFINDDGDVRRHVGGMQPEELQAEIDRLIAS